MSRNQIHYLNTLAAIEMVADTGLIDLTEEGYMFLTQERNWINTDRSNARRCIEAVVYGSLQKLGIPHTAAPCEIVAAVIAVFVKPANLMVACAWMDGAEWSVNVINGVEKPCSANVLFAHVINVRAGLSESLINSKVKRLAEMVGAEEMDNG